MGQKTSPIGFRLVQKRKWRSTWYAEKNEFGDLLVEDFKIRRYLKSRPCCTGASEFSIKRMSEKLEITIFTCRPGIVIGKKGVEIEQLKQHLRKMTGKDVWIEVEEVKRPELAAALVAEGIAKSLARRMPFRKVLKKALADTMAAGALGIKVLISGRIAGAEIARDEGYQDGRVPLHTMRMDVDYAAEVAYTTYGTLGVKVWITKGDVVLGKTSGRREKGA